MTTSVQERLKLGTFEFNDGTHFTIESLTFSPAQKKPMWITNSDADGEALVRESHFTNSYFEFKVRVEPQASVAAGLERLGELTDAVQSCERVAGGQTLEWTPATTEKLRKAYATSADVTGIPIEVAGDDAGWLFGSPVVTVKLTCAPFLKREPRTIKASVESGAEPFQLLYIGGVGGDVPAEARLIVKDTATQDRRFAMWGRDVVTSETNPTLLLSAKSGLTGTGFSGEAKTRTGAYLEEKVLRGTAVSQPTTLCGTGRIGNVGSYGIHARVYATSEAARFRISYRNGDGPLIPLEWKEPTVVNGWSELFMGEVFFDAVQLGAQTSEVRIEQKATEGNPANDVNYLMLWPTTKASGKARGIAIQAATNLIAYDNFEQSEGNLESKAPNFPTAITWTETNKTGANGFKVKTGGVLERTAVSDATLNSGCFALLGATSYSTFQSSVSLLAGTAAPTNAASLGLLGRYVSTEKWVIAVVQTVNPEGSKRFHQLAVIKNISGVVSTLGTISISGFLSTHIFETLTLQLLVAANGAWTAAVGGKEIAGHDLDLATGGTLAAGKVGLYDAYTSATAGARMLEGFQVLGAEEPGRVCYSGKQVEFNLSGCLRQDSTGAYDGPPSSYRGAGFYLDPAGELGLINRVAVRMRRNDNEAEEDSTVTDKQSVEVLVTERDLIPR